MMAKAAAPSTSCEPPVRLTLVSPAGPNLAYHVGFIINNTFYVHGGIDKKGSTKPLNKLYAMDLGCGIWQEVRAPDSPALSHHTGVVLDNRYLVLIGGWDGKRRTCDMFAFDIEESRWITLATSGFHTSAGLSSHTASVLASGEILVIGREGSARLQRRFGNGWLLSGSVSSGAFKYTDFEVDLDSRAGHTTDCVAGKIINIGGRKDKLIQILPQLKGVTPKCAIMSKFAKITETAEPMKKPPCGRKHHVAVSGAGVVIVHGGETFDGKSREPVGDIYLVSFKPTISWYKLINTTVGRAGHVIAQTDETIMFHGGEGSRGVIHADTYQIEVTYS